MSAPLKTRSFSNINPYFLIDGIVSKFSFSEKTRKYDLPPTFNAAANSLDKKQFICEWELIDLIKRVNSLEVGQYFYQKCQQEIMKKNRAIVSAFLDMASNLPGSSSIVREVFENYLKNDPNASSEDYNRALRAAIKEKDEKLANELFQKGQYNSSTYLLQLEWELDQQNTQKVYAVFDQAVLYFKSQGKRLDKELAVQCFNTFIGFTFQNDDSETALNTFEIAKEMNLVDEKTYELMIGGIGDSFQLKNFFNKHVKDAVHYKIKARHRYLQSMGDFLDFPRAKKVFEELVNKGNASIDTYNLFLRAASLCGRFSEAAKTFKQLPKNIQANLETYIYYMRAMGAQDPFRNVEQVYRLAKQNIPDSIELNNAFIREAGRAKQLSAAFKVYEKMEDKNEETYAEILRAFRGKKSSEQIFIKSQEKHPNSTLILNAYLEDLLASGKIEKIQALMFQGGKINEIADFTSKVLYVESLSGDRQKTMFDLWVKPDLIDRKKKLGENVFDFRGLKFGVAKLYLESILSQFADPKKQVFYLVYDRGLYLEKDPFYFRNEFEKIINKEFKNLTAMKDLDSSDRIKVHKKSSVNF